MERQNDYRQARWSEPLLIELSDTGGTCNTLNIPEPLVAVSIPDVIARKNGAPRLPELSRLEVVRHFTRLSQMNFGINSGMYPLGSCTMKYNPPLCERIAGLESVRNTHPVQDASTIQGCLELMHELGRALCEISGMNAISLQPAAGAHGEFTGVKIIRKHIKETGQEGRRDELIIPDSGHGTNPASAALAGFKVVVVPSDPNTGCVDLDALKNVVSGKTAGLMLTNPNTLGIFEKDIKEIAKVIHDAGGLLYYDGANLNAIMGITNPGLMGFDIVHFNLHKTFSTPHGGGGAGAGPVAVVESLAKYLPKPVVRMDSHGKYFLDYDMPHSIGPVKAFYGNFAVMVRAYAYILMLGGAGLTEVSKTAVLNSNYLLRKIEKILGTKLSLEYDPTRPRKHEFVLSATPLGGVKPTDIAHALLDEGVHAPTIYFPQIVHDAVMIEPTETECKRILDEFAEKLKTACAIQPGSPPKNTAVGIVDQALSVKEPRLTWND